MKEQKMKLLCEIWCADPFSECIRAQVIYIATKIHIFKKKVKISMFTSFMTSNQVDHLL